MTTKAVAPQAKQVHIPMTQEPTGAAALMVIINKFAADPTLDVAKLESLLAVKDRWDREEARKAFVVALNNFKANPPSVGKNKHVHFDTQKGSTDYRHATLDNVSTLIGDALAVHGLSHRWDTTQSADGKIMVTCIVTHTGGHSERVSLMAPADTSGSKNSIQAIASTVTYLERYTLLAATGVAVIDQDNDGKGDTAPIAGPEDEPAPAHIPAEVVQDPVKFVPASVTKKGKQFVINGPLAEDRYLTLDEPQAVIARDAAKANREIKLLYTLRDGARWVDGLALVEAASGDEF